MQKTIYVILQEDANGDIELVEAFTSLERAQAEVVELLKEYEQEYYIENIVLTDETWYG
jgi:hypothetical protein